MRNTVRLKGGADVDVLGVRARAQLDKRRRIAAAAEAVFREKGFDGAGLREIAARARVSTGTIFQFAPDKRTLLAIVFNEHLDAHMAKAFATLDRSTPLIGQLVHVFGERYKYLRRDPDLAVHLIQELTFPSRVLVADDSPMGAYLRRRAAFRAQITSLIADQQRLGRLTAKYDAGDITDIVRAINLMEVREWLASAEKPTIANGLQRLRKVLEIALSGLL